MAADRSIDFAPVVDDLVVETPFGSPVTLDPLSSAVAYGCASVVATSLDLDPATPGAQTVWTTPRGTFAVAADQRVVFTPLAGVSGIAQATYAMADARGQRSNAGTLTVTTLPDPNAPVLLVASFEDGTEGWAPASWQPLIGTTSSSAGFASEGTQALRIDTLADGWFGVVPPKALNLQGRPHLKFDIRATNAGTSQNIAIKTGASYVWCQGPWGYLNPGTTTAIDIDLTQLTCDATAGAPPDLSDVRELYLFFSAGGTFYIDNVRAQ
jgi:mannan endo-1,4-beta-mannosidase